MAVCLGTLTASGQTWLERSLDGTTLPGNPPTVGSPSVYAEPLDTAWRQGNTGIGTESWPFTKLHVHEYDNVSLASLTSFLTGYGLAPENFSGIFTNGGDAGANSTGSILGYATESNDANDFTNAIFGAAIGDGQNLLMGVVGTAEGDNNNDDVYGLNGQAKGSGNPELFGVNGVADGDDTDGFNHGVHGSAMGDVDSDNVGVEGQADETADINYGVRGYACNGATETYGVYGVACTTGTMVDFAGYFEGDVEVTGAGYIPSVWNTSDKRLKENIDDYKAALKDLREVRIHTYSYKDVGYLQLPKGEQVGVIAQELETVFPNLTSDAQVQYGIEGNRKSAGYKAVNYIGLIPVLIRAVQELDEKVTALEEENNRLKGNDDAGKTDSFLDGLTEVSDATEVASSMILMPNPSNDLMTVAVNRGECNNCMLVITDLQGKKVTTITLTKSGRQTVSKSEVGEGIFLCNLIVDGKPVSVERMVFL